MKHVITALSFLLCLSFVISAAGGIVAAVKEDDPDAGTIPVKEARITAAPSEKEEPEADSYPENNAMAVEMKPEHAKTVETAREKTSGTGEEDQKETEKKDRSCSGESVTIERTVPMVRFLDDTWDPAGNIGPVLYLKMGLERDRTVPFRVLLQFETADEVDHFIQGISGIGIEEHIEVSSVTFSDGTDSSLYLYSELTRDLIETFAKTGIQCRYVGTGAEGTEEIRFDDWEFWNSKEGSNASCEYWGDNYIVIQ